MSANWFTEAEKAEILSLALSGEVLNKDIAARFGRRPAAVTYCLKQLGVRNTAKDKIVGKWNNKHAHLREDLLKYYLNHTAEECQKRFKLTPSEFRSCLTYAYKIEDLKHLRKETRRHDPWSVKELRFLLAHAGLQPRDWIAKKLNRGGALGIKDRLDLLGVSSQNLNGLTLSKFRILFNKDPDFYLQTKAGPRRSLKNRETTASYYKIIPWVWMDQEIKAKRLMAPPMYQKMIQSMALFQEWVHGGNALKKMKRICKQK
jgi:hypothetical protein